MQILKLIETSKFDIPKFVNINVNRTHTKSKPLSVQNIFLILSVVIFNGFKSTAKVVNFEGSINTTVYLEENHSFNKKCQYVLLLSHVAVY